MPYLPPREHGQLCSLGSGPQIANSRRRGEHFSVVPPVRECIFLTSLTARWLCVVLNYFAWFSDYENMSSVYVINPPSKSQRVVQQAVGFRTSSYSIKVCCSTVNHILYKYTYQMEILALQKSVVSSGLVQYKNSYTITWPQYPVIFICNYIMFPDLPTFVHFAYKLRKNIGVQLYDLLF